MLLTLSSLSLAFIPHSLSVLIICISMWMCVYGSVVSERECVCVHACVRACVRACIHYTMCNTATHYITLCGTVLGVQKIQSTTELDFSGSVKNTRSSIYLRYCSFSALSTLAGTLCTQLLSGDSSD